MAASRLRPGFTIIELLVVVSIITLLLAILLPAIGKSREATRTTVSASNLRQMAIAHASYAAEWGDRQHTMIVDNLAAYGNSPAAAIGAYAAANGGEPHPGVDVGWGTNPLNGQPVNWHFPPDLLANSTLLQPVSFGFGAAYFGHFRLPNTKGFNQYMSGRFYDKVFYAPKDTHVNIAVGQCFTDPGEFCDPGFSEVTEEEPFCLHPLVTSNTPAWSSYCLSPAAMFDPSVLSSRGSRNPWTIPAGFRSPAFSQALYPSMKTHVLEHHWLQNSKDLCNPGFNPGTYDNCEPYYFNHAWESSPTTLFYDGHVESVGVRRTMRADGRVTTQTGGEFGLWSRDTVWGENGYMSEFGYDQAQSSFHILTTDGIRGRDVMP